MISYSSISPLLFAFSFLMVGGIFSFITAPLSIIGKVVAASKTKAAAKIAAADAAKQRAHEAKMAALAAQTAATAQVGQSKLVQTLALAGGGVILAYLFIFKKKR